MYTMGLKKHSYFHLAVFSWDFFEKLVDIQILYEILRKIWCRLQMDRIAQNVSFPKGSLVFTLGIPKVMDFRSLDSTEIFWWEWHHSFLLSHPHEHGILNNLCFTMACWLFLVFLLQFATFTFKSNLYWYVSRWYELFSNSSLSKYIQAIWDPYHI